MGEDNLIKLNTYTNLSMLNPNLNSKFTFCVQGVPKLWPILAIMNIAKTYHNMIKKIFFFHNC